MIFQIFQCLSRFTKMPPKSTLVKSSTNRPPDQLAEDSKWAEILLVPYFVLCVLYFVTFNTLVQLPTESFLAAVSKALPIWYLAFYVGRAPDFRLVAVFILQNIPSYQQYAFLFYQQCRSRYVYIDIYHICKCPISSLCWLFLEQNFPYTSAATILFSSEMGL